MSKGLGSVPVLLSEVRGAYSNMALSRIVDVERTGSCLPALTRAVVGMFEPASGQNFGGTDRASINSDILYHNNQLRALYSRPETIQNDYVGWQGGAA